MTLHHNQSYMDLVEYNLFIFETSMDYFVFRDPEENLAMNFNDRNERNES